MDPLPGTLPQSEPAQEFKAKSDRAISQESEQILPPPM
jgi:hypothetical protein